jgi:hypothetical protein
LLFAVDGFLLFDALRQMKVVARYIIQFFAGLGMDSVSTGAYFLARDSYLHSLPNLYGNDLSEHMSAHAVIVIVAMFLFFQLVAYLGVRIAIGSLVRNDKMTHPRSIDGSV